MRLRMAVLLYLILPMTLLSSQSLPELVNDYTHCFTAIEWAAFEEEVWQEEQAMMLEAANTAIQPYKLEIKKMERKILWWKIGCGAAIAAALTSLLWAALK